MELGGAEEANRLKDEFLATLSHELRTPLTSLRTNIEVLARDEEMPAEEREHVAGGVGSEAGEIPDLRLELRMLRTSTFSLFLPPSVVFLQRADEEVIEQDLVL